jgi:hypothetical protein
MLKHDESGFLVGQSMDLGGEANLLQAIHGDVRAIRNALTGNATRERRTRKISTASSINSDLERSPSTTTRNSVVSLPKSKISAVSVPSIVSEPGEAKAPLNSMVTPTASPVAIPKQIAPPVGNTGKRDANGRFVSRGSNGASSDENEDGSENTRISGALRFLGENIESISNINAEGADPMVKAYNEIAQPVSGLVGGLNSLSGMADGEGRFYTRWFRKITGLMIRSKKADEESSKITNDLLEDIKDKSTASGASDSKTSNLPNIIPSVLLPLMKKGSGLFKLLKKIPVLGALLGSGAALMSIFDSENNHDLSRREKDASAGKAVGGIGGMFTGMATGALLGTVIGPIGTVIGGILGAFLGDSAGQIIGEKVGLWVNDLRAYDIPGKVVAVWKKVTDPIMSVASGIASWWGENVPSLAVMKDGVGGFLSDKLGINLPSVSELQNTAASAISDTVVGKAAYNLFGLGSPTVSNQQNGVVNVVKNIPSLPAMAPVKPPSPAPDTSSPKQVNTAKATIKAVVAPSDAGQDVRDRQISHIATGGMN